MQIRSFFSVTNIVFLVGGCYFVIVASLGEATVYSVILAVLCFVSFLVSFREGLYFAGPWRVATATAVLVLLGGQAAVSLEGPASDAFTALIIVLNGILFVVFVGVLLSTSREVTKQKSTEEEMESEEELESSA